MLRLQDRSDLIPLHIHLPTVDTPQLLRIEGEYVGDIVDAAIAKFKQLDGTSRTKWCSSSSPLAAPWFCSQRTL